LSALDPARRDRKEANGEAAQDEIHFFMASLPLHPIAPARADAAPYFYVATALASVIATA